MTPQEKAEQLVQSYISAGFLPFAAEIAAELCVLEIKEVVREAYDEDSLAIHMIYWEKVLNEIGNLQL